MTPEPLKVDAELLAAAGRRLLTAAQGLPDAPEPFTPSYGSDALSQALSQDVPAAEAPIIAGLPPLKESAIGTAESVIEAARRYASTDSQLRSKYDDLISGADGGSPSGGAVTAGQAPGGAGGAVTASAASGAGGMGGPMGALMGVPMQMAQQAGQIPQQVAGMAGSLPQAAMQGAQQVGEQVTQLVEQFSPESPSPEAKAGDDAEEGSAVDGIGERAPVDQSESSANSDPTIDL